jgi:hypothetical protein
MSKIYYFFHPNFGSYYIIGASVPIPNSLKASNPIKSGYASLKLGKMCDLTFCWLGQLGVLEPAEGLLLGSHHEVALSHVQDGAHVPHLQDKRVSG